MKGSEFIGAKPFEITLSQNTAVYRKRNGRLVLYKEKLKAGKIVGIEDVSTSKRGRSTRVVGRFSIDNDTTQYFIMLADVETDLQNRHEHLMH